MRIEYYLETQNVGDECHVVRINRDAELAHQREHAAQHIAELRGV
jgi:hypothetical protein